MPLLFLLAFCLLLGRAAADGFVAVPPGFPGKWRGYERFQTELGDKSIVVRSGFIAGDDAYGDAEITMRLRAPESAKEVQAWAGFRVADEDRRYVVGLRGGNNDLLYLARYAPDAQSAFLGIAPLGFHPRPGEWHALRIVTSGRQILVFLDGEKLPRLNARDDAPLWDKGGVELGGGYLPAEFSDVQVAPLSPEGRAEAERLKDQVWKAPEPDREALRREQRAAYRPLSVPELPAGRAEIDLGGKWLFKPDQELASGAQPAQAGSDDQSWHVMDVPAFWTPTLCWLYGESAFAPLKGVSGQKGVSDKAFLREMDRLGGYTFNWSATQAAWYRTHLALPASIAGRKAVLHFDAIAKISEVWVNGTKVGAHTGMFGEVQCDISQAVHPGDNVIAVHVLRNLKSAAAAGDQQVGVAVTVEITQKMLASLPAGMYDMDPAGIWQPVRLEVTDPVSVSDVFVKPALDGAQFDVEVANGSASGQDVDVSYAIRSVADGSTLAAQEHAGKASVAAGATAVLALATPKIAPKWWSPSDPNLYELEVVLNRDGKPVDRRADRFGFRTFAVDGNRLLLNGRPYWLRGGNYFPLPLRPNDAALAEKFVALAKAGNVNATRTHAAPLTEAWAGETDRQGMLVSFEGFWPWLMLKGGVPPPPLLDSWRDDFSLLVKKYRNHPSVVIWTINNEMKFHIFDEKNPDLLKQKWAVVSDMIKAIRRLDPTRPVVADSGYIRRERQQGYDTVVRPNGFDDGDIDDSHSYNDWYTPTFLALYDGSYGKRADPARPLISQEMSTGYPRNDDGLPARFYLFKHCTPQALVGKFAFEHNDPAWFLARQAFLTKQQAEVIRRTNHAEMAGTMLFSYLTWFKDVFDKDSIEPGPAYYALQSAMSPVLVSAELHGWHYYAGAALSPRVTVVNDAESGEAIPAGSLQWEVDADGKPLAQGAHDVPEIPYYGTAKTSVDIALPAALPRPRTEAQLKLRLVAGGAVVSENAYDVVLAERAWAAPKVPSGAVVVCDPKGALPAAALPEGAAKAASVGEAVAASPKVLVVAGPLSDADAGRVRAYAEAGGRVLLAGPGASAKGVVPGISGWRAVRGEIVGMNRPGSPVFDGLTPLDLSWFSTPPDRLPVACDGVYSLGGDGGATVLADYCAIHGYLDKPSDVLKFTGAAIVEAPVGRGTALASEMTLSAAGDDPVAGRLLGNMIGRLLSDAPAN